MDSTRDFFNVTRALQVHFLLIDLLNHTSVKVSADLFPDVHGAGVTGEWCGPEVAETNVAVVASKDP